MCSSDLQLELDIEQVTGSKLGKECQGCILSPCLFNFYAEYIMRNAGLEDHPSRSSESTLEGWDKSFSISSLSNFCTAPRLEASQNDYHQPLFFCTCCSLSLEYPSLPVDLFWLNQSISLPGEAFLHSFPHHQMLG